LNLLDFQLIGNQFFFQIIKFSDTNLNYTSRPRKYKGKWNKNERMELERRNVQELRN